VGVTAETAAVFVEKIHPPGNWTGNKPQNDEDLFFIYCCRISYTGSFLTGATPAEIDYQKTCPQSIRVNLSSLNDKMAVKSGAEIDLLSP